MYGAIFGRRPNSKAFPFGDDCARGSDVFGNPRSFQPKSWRPHWGARQLSASEHLHFAVRSIGGDGRGHVLQYAFADDRGNVILTAFARGASPVAMPAAFPPEDLGVEPLDPEAFEYLMSRICGGATLVAYHRVLQGGLLPYSAVSTAASVECAWRRFQQVARRRGVRLSRGEPLTLGDCLEKAGLPPLESEDAAVRALAIRALWRWMED